MTPFAKPRAILRLFKCSWQSLFRSGVQEGHGRRTTAELAACQGLSRVKEWSLCLGDSLNSVFGIHSALCIMIVSCSSIFLLAVASGWAPAGHCHAMFADGGLAQLAVSIWMYMIWNDIYIWMIWYDNCNLNFVSLLPRFAMFWCLATPRNPKTGQALRSSWRTAGWKRMRMQDTEDRLEHFWLRLK